jgi:hypothetical protein
MKVFVIDLNNPYCPYRVAIFHDKEQAIAEAKKLSDVSNNGYSVDSMQTDCVDPEITKIWASWESDK